MTVTVRPLVRDVVRELLGRKFNPLQPRDGDGKWSKDKLNLAGKMDLEDGEEVAASGSFKTMGASAVMAKTSYPEYPGLESLYVGIVAPEDERKWRGHALGSTAVLDRGEVAELRKNLDGLEEKVFGEESKMIDEWDAIQEFGGHEDGADLTPGQNAQVDAFYQRYGGDRIDSGVLVEDISGSALVYNIFGAEGDDGNLQLLTAVAIRPDGEGDDWYPDRWENAMVFEDWPEIKAFGRELDKVDGGSDARLLSAGVVRKFDPSQPRDENGKWSVIDLSMPDFDTFTSDEYEDEFGAEHDSYGIELDNQGSRVDARVFEDGSIHITYSFKGRDGERNYQPFITDLDSDGLMEIDSGIFDVLTSDPDDWSDPDEQEVVFEADSNVFVGLTEDGDVLLGGSLLLDPEQARRFQEALVETAKAADALDQDERSVRRNRVSRKFDPSQPRDENGRFSKAGAIKKALEAFAGPQDDQGVTSGAYLPDRDGAEPGRFMEIEPADEMFTLRFGHDSEADADDDEVEQEFAEIPVYANELVEFGRDLTLHLMAREKPDLDPSKDRQSLLLSSLLATDAEGATTFGEGGESYIDYSVTHGGETSFEAGNPDGDVVRFDLNDRELEQLHAAVMSAIIKAREATGG